MGYVIEADKIVKTYGEFQAVKGISFQISEGECYGFLGHNGAGKSTTMRMLYGLSTVSSGKLKMLGESIKLTPPHIKAQLGIVPQEDNLDTDLSVIENLEVYGGFFGIRRRECYKRGIELLSFMGMEEKATVSTESLSGGLKRRLVIARALINQPRILILDEPTTGLDPQARRLVWQKLRLLKAQGTTLILTTHYMEEAAQLCDRIAIMNDGLILDEASPDQLVVKHVLPYVIEVRAPIDEIPEKLCEKVTAAGSIVEEYADGLFFYTNDGQGLLRQVDEWGLAIQFCYLRSTNLEDVYLKLTGRLFENDN